MPHKRSSQALSRREERKKLWREAHYDLDKAEVISQGLYPHLLIGHGEVLRSPTHQNPSLE